MTPNQIRAAELLSQGLSHQEVAEACNVSRRTILRWLNQGDFKNLSFAMINRQRPAQQAPQRLENANGTNHHSSNLKPSDLVADALTTVRDILRDSDVRVADRLRAATLAGEWAGLAHQKSKMVEVEAIKALIDTGWLPDQVLEALIDGCEALESKMKSAFAQNGHQNDHKKALLQESEEGLFDIDDEFEDE